MKKIKRLLIMSVIMMTVIMWGNVHKAEAANKYIKIEDYIEYIVKEMKWDIDKTSKQPYIDVAMDIGILKEGDFKSYTEYLTRTDAAVIANRLDEIINLKYGYPQNVYEFLKDCTLYEGKLFYTTEGSLYPKGATRETYPEEIFHEEVVIPILDEYFKDDKWKDKGLRTGYKYLNDLEGNILKRYMEIGVVPKRAETFDIASFDEKSDVLQAWNVIHDYDRKVNAVLDKRISDIKDIPKAKRDAVASIVAKGIIKGYSNGLYVQNREFKGNKKITVSGAKSVIQMVLNSEKRAPISPDGQLIRTTKLPKNYKDYEYILESFPNKYYEMKYSFMFLSDYESGKIKKDEYAYPKEVDYRYLYDNFYHCQMKLDMDKYENYNIVLSKVEKYLQHIFNVDYRTVDDKWKEGLAYTFDQYGHDRRIYTWIDRYIEAMKKNKVVVESERISIEPSTIYDSRGRLYVRVYVKYRVTAKDMNAPSNELLYGEYNSILETKNGVWRYGYYDIAIRSSYNQWGVIPQNIISDWMYSQSFK